MIKSSVILTNYNNSHNIKRCLDSLFNQNYNSSQIDLEIIVVDAGSTDKSISILNKYRDKVKIILNPTETCNSFPLCSASVRNIGARNSKGDILIFSDSDCVFPSDWVKEMINSFKNPRIDGVIGNREPDVGEGLGTFIRRYDFILYSNKFRISKPMIINKKNLQEGMSFVSLSGNNFAIKKEVLIKLGGMKTVFKHPAGEDVMLEIDLIKNGYNILFNPQSKVVHSHPLSMKELVKKVFPRSEAIHLLSKYSDSFVNWRHFAARGHILNLKSFSLSILFVILTLLITGLLKIPPLTTLSVLLMAILVLIIYRTVRVRKRLESILNSKNKRYKKIYKISLFKLFWFEQIHFFLKSIALINFLWCSLFKK